MKQSPNTDGWGWKLGLLEETQISRGTEDTRRRINIDHGLNEHEEFGKYTCYLTDEKLMGTRGLVLSHHQRFSTVDLMQNCDLPPPLKVFVGAEKPAGIPPSSMKIGCDQEEDYNTEGEKLGLLKALQLSQTRAREAERKVRFLSKEREHLSNTLLQESLRLFAHRQWVELLQLEVAKKRSQEQMQKQEQSCCGCGRPDGERGSSEEEEEDDQRNENCGFKWSMALALCLGIAAFGCRYLFRGFTFPPERAGFRCIWYLSLGDNEFAALQLH